MISRCTRTGDPEFSDKSVLKWTQTHLLAEADPWSRIKREEDERVRNKVLLHTLVQEPVGVKF